MQEAGGMKRPSRRYFLGAFGLGLPAYYPFAAAIAAETYTMRLNTTDTATSVLGVAALSFAFTGPGSLSLDALLGNQLNGTLWGIAALFVGILGGVFSLIQRRPTSAHQTEIVG